MGVECRFASETIPVADQQEIIEKVEQVFMRYGIKSVTMDDLARELGHSKKTLYQFFDNKDDLVEQVMRSHVESTQLIIQRIIDEAENAIDAYIQINQHHYQFLREMNPSILYDIQKYYPTSWHQFNLHKNEFVKNAIRNNLQQGIGEGYFRSDMNVDVIALFYIYKMELFADAQLLHEHGLERMECLPEIVKYHLFGIITPKGKAYLESQKLFDHENV